MLSDLISIELAVDIILWIYAVTLFIQLIYYLGIYSRLVFFRISDTKNEKPPVSVIICSRNEAHNLQRYLPSVLTQEYPEYEVIVVNDSSTDDTGDILEKMSKEYPRLRYTTIPYEERFRHNKKLAVTVGIKAARHEHLLFTDADCYAESKDWISSMCRNFDDKTDIILGYGGYTAEKGLLNKFIRFDTLFIALQYFSYALAGSPYMGVGRNLAYKKSLFFQNKGFASHSHIVSGDDDLFINEVGTKRNTRIEVSKQSHTRSEPEKTIRAWVIKKRRHLTTGVRYKFVHKILLSGEPATRIFFYISFVLLLIFNVYPEYIGGAFLLRLIVQIIILKITINRLCEKYLLLYSLPFDIVMPFFNIGLTIANYIISRRERWN